MGRLLLRQREPMLSQAAKKDKYSRFAGHCGTMPASRRGAGLLDVSSSTLEKSESRSRR